MDQAEETKKAVKEALDDRRMEELDKHITDLSNQMAAGFAGVHQRQDTTNGKVLKHSEQIAAIKSKDSYDKLVWLLVTTLVGLVVYLVTKH